MLSTQPRLNGNLLVDCVLGFYTPGALGRRPWHISRDREGVVFSIIRIFPSPKQRNQVIEILRSVQDLTRPSPGCLGCWLSEEDNLHNHIRYAEQWETEEGLHDHVRSDLYRRVLAAMELSRHSPEVTFHYTKDVKGFDLIEALRTASRQPKMPSSAD